jgi:hypothetical protein
MAVDPEVYDTISQRPATIAEFAELVKQTAALWQALVRPRQENPGEGRANVPFVIVGHCAWPTSERLGVHSSNA